MLERYEIENIEQLRAIADVLRLRIIDVLLKRSMTVTQLGEALGLAPAKVHYHVRELERVGLLRLVETREKGGILEKYYQPIARDISVGHALLSASSDEAVATISTWFGQVKDDFLRAFRHELELKGEKRENILPLGLGFSRLYITPAELRDLFKQINELLKPFETARDIAGEQEVLAMVVTYPEGGPVDSSTASLAPLPVTQADEVWAVGASHYSRAELEKVRAEGKRLNITVVGVCQFADDVSAELADQAIEHFNIIGKLFASTAVREVLSKKRSD
jgi:DNA-binding transcriptional ArsR family regulator